MQLQCPKCETLIPAEKMNVATDLAVCPSCDEVFQLSELVASGGDAADVDLSDPPRGVWFHRDFDGFRLGASLRSPIAFFLVPFMCVWSGFSLGGIYGTQIWKGEFDLGTSLFGIPFVIGTLLFGSIALMSVCGKVVIRVDRNHGSVFTGVGPFGWRRRFDWREVQSVKEPVSANSDSANSKSIALEGEDRLVFGSGLNEARRYFVLQALRRMLHERGR